MDSQFFRPTDHLRLLNYLNNRKPSNKKKLIDRKKFFIEENVIQNDSKKRMKHSFSQSKEQAIKKIENDVKSFLNKHRSNQNSLIKSSIVQKERSRLVANKAQHQLAATKFRQLNEYLYTHSSDEAQNEFSLEKFAVYHEAYSRLMDQWPVKPIDYMIEILKERIKNKKVEKLVIADIGCGKEALIAKAFLESTVFSFDLYSSSSNSQHDKSGFAEISIKAADMCHLPLQNNQCDYAIYSLSLMPTNLRDVFCEANRILKKSNGYMLIVEVASRFADSYHNHSLQQLRQQESIKVIKKKKNFISTINNQDDNDDRIGQRFINDLCKWYGFRLTQRKLLPPNGYFVFFSFKKVSQIAVEKRKSLPAIQLKACVYKARHGLENANQA